MGSPYIGEIRMVGFNFPPVSWALCNGNLMPIAQNEALYSLMGTTYGGDGVANFALPNLRSRVPVHMGPSYAIGANGGVENVTLNLSQIPSHFHAAFCNTGGTHSSTNPSGNVWVNWAQNQYSNVAPAANMNAAALGVVGGSQPHNNMLPYGAINFIVSLNGIFPPRG